MRFPTRASIALLAGVGAGLIGFAVVWKTVWAVVGEHPGIAHDAWLLTGIFGPGVFVAAGVFHALSRATVRPAMAEATR